MRNLETRLAEAEVTQHQDIQIKCTGAVGNACRAVAAEVVLDGEKGIEEGPRSEPGFKRDDRVEKTRLVRIANGRCGVERGLRDDAAESGKTARGGGEGSIGRTCGAREVRPHADVGGAHGQQGIAAGAGFGTGRFTARRGWFW